MNLTDPVERAIRQAYRYRDICLRAALNPKYSPMSKDLERLAEMWQGFAVQAQSAGERIAESRQFLSRIDEQLKQPSRTSA